MTTATIAPAIPERTIKQRLEALQNANRIRSYRAQVKRDLFSMSRDAARQQAAALVLDPPADLETMYAMQLLLSVRSIGRAKAHKILRRADVSTSRTLGGLTQRQRAAIIRELAPW